MYMCAHVFVCVCILAEWWEELGEVDSKDLHFASADNLIKLPRGNHGLFLGLGFLICNAKFTKTALLISQSVYKN